MKNHQDNQHLPAVLNMGVGFHNPTGPQGETGFSLKINFKNSVVKEFHFV